MFLALFFALTGCASTKSFVKGFLGISSVDSLHNRTQGRFSSKYDLAYGDCYGKVLKIIRNMNARVFVEKKKSHCIGASNFDTAFLNCLDATEVGIFFVETSPTRTQADVVSKNSRLSKFVFDQIGSKIYAKIPEPATSNKTPQPVKGKSGQGTADIKK